MSTKNKEMLTKTARREFWAAFGTQFGGKGGRTAAANMTPEQRIERAKKAVAVREANRAKRKANDAGTGNIAVD